MVEALIRRRLPKRIIEDVIRLQGEYGCLLWYVETIPFQEFFADVLYGRALERGIAVPIRPIKPVADKALRIETLEPPISRGSIRIHADHRELLSQLSLWPQHEHDDGPDGLEMLWQAAQHLMRRGTYAYTPVGGGTAAPDDADHRGWRPDPFGSDDGRHRAGFGRGAF